MKNLYAILLALFVLAICEGCNTLKHTSSNKMTCEDFGINKNKSVHVGW